MVLFTKDEAKAFRYQGQVPLAQMADDDLEAAEARIRAAFEDICGVAFSPVADTVATVDGRHNGPLILPHPLVTAITGATTYRGGTTGTDLTTEQLDALEIDGWLLHWRGGWWPGGGRAVRLTYTHGYADPPLEIKRAALILAVEQLSGSNISPRATQQTNEVGTFNLAVPGWREGQYFGLPEVDAVLAREAAKWKGPRVA